MMERDFWERLRSERQKQKDCLIKRQRMKERSRVGCLALNLSLTCLFLLSSPLPPSLPLSSPLSSDSSLSARSSPSLSHSPSLSPPLTPPLPTAIGQTSTNHNKTGTWGTAYAKRCLIFMSCYRGFKSLIRTAAQLSVPTACLAGCVCTYSPLFLALTYASCAHTHTHIHMLPHIHTHAEISAGSAEPGNCIAPSKRKEGPRERKTR